MTSLYTQIHRHLNEYPLMLQYVKQYYTKPFPERLFEIEIDNKHNISLNFCKVIILK